MTPEVLWAQRSDEIFLTINVSDVKDPKIDLQPTTLTFEGQSAEKKYKVELNFNKEVDPAVSNSSYCRFRNSSAGLRFTDLTQLPIQQESKINKSGRTIDFVLAKKEKNQEYWPRLLKDAKKPNFLKTDFSKWKDEDEDEEEKAGFDGLDMSKFQGLGGMGGGMGGLEGLGGMGGMGGMSGMGGMDFGVSINMRGT